jgi:hypothetical protein
VIGQLHVSSTLPRSERALNNHWKGGWMDTRTGVVEVEKRHSYPYRSSNSRLLGRPSRSRSPYRYKQCSVSTIVYVIAPNYSSFHVYIFPLSGWGQLQPYINKRQPLSVSLFSRRTESCSLTLCCTLWCHIPGSPRIMHNVQQNIILFVCWPNITSQDRTTYWPETGMEGDNVKMDLNEMRGEYDDWSNLTQDRI